MPRCRKFTPNKNNSAQIRLSCWVVSNWNIHWKVSPKNSLLLDSHTLRSYTPWIEVTRTRLLPVPSPTAWPVLQTCDRCTERESATGQDWRAVGLVGAVVAAPSQPMGLACGLACASSASIDIDRLSATSRGVESSWRVRVMRY